MKTDTKLTDAVALLRQYNAWRKTNDIHFPMPDPAAVGQALDVVCDEVVVAIAERDRYKADYHDLIQLRGQLDMDGQRIEALEAENVALREDKERLLDAANRGLAALVKTRRWAATHIPDEVDYIDVDVNIVKAAIDAAKGVRARCIG